MRDPLVLPAPAPLPVPPDLAERLAGIKVTLDDTAVSRIADFLGRLLAMNEHMNLTAITYPAEVWTRHALDALTLVPELARLPPKARVVDLGSGGGVPGIILAIARLDFSFTLVEATAKKAAFLADVAAALGLTNVTVLNVRAESLHAGTTLRAFDAVTARAVGKLEVLIPLAAPLIKTGGRMLFIKGERADDERMAAQKQLMRQRCRHRRTTQTPTGRVVVFVAG